MFRITYEQGNGYRCGCCRQTWTETEDCESREDVILWLSELEASKKGFGYGDSDDREVIEIREIKDDDLTSSFHADSALIEQIIQQRKDYAAKEKADREKKEAEDKKVRELKTLKELKEKYPEV